MVTLKEYLEHNYQNRQEKETVKELNFFSIEGLEECELNFDGTEWKKLEGITFRSKQLRGTLTISGCPKLKRIQCRNNSITCLDLSGLAKDPMLYRLYNRLLLEELNLSDNELTEIVWSTEFATKPWILYVGGNKFTNFDFLNSLGDNLSRLDVQSNNFPPSDLTPFSRFTSLSILRLDDNFFKGSLEPIKNMTRLEELGINDTNINEGAEYLLDFKDLVRLYCFPSKKDRDRSQVIEIKMYLTARTKSEFSVLDYWHQEGANTNYASRLFQLRINRLEKQLKLEREQKEIELEQERNKKSNPKDKEIIEELTKETERLTIEVEKLKTKNERLKRDKDNFYYCLDSIKDLVSVYGERDEETESEEENSSQLENQEQEELISRVEVPPKQ